MSFKTLLKSRYTEIKSHEQASVCPGDHRAHKTRVLPIFPKKYLPTAKM